MAMTSNGCADSIADRSEDDIQQKESFKVDDVNLGIKETFIVGAEDSSLQRSRCARIRTDRVYRCKLLHTVCTTWAMVSSGMAHTMTGLAFPDIMLIINQGLAKSSWIFTAWSFGNMIGSLLSGFTYDRFNKLVVLISLSVGLSVTTGLTPWCTNYTAMLMIHLIGGGFASAIHSTVTADTILLWEHRKATYLQIVHLAATAGGILSPFAVNPFLAKRHIPRVTDSSNITNPSHSNSNTDFQHVAVSMNSSTANEQDVNVSFRASNRTLHDLPLIYEDTNIQYAYLIGSGFAFVAVILYIMVRVSNGSPYQPKTYSATESMETTTKSSNVKLTRNTIFFFVITVFLQIMVYVTTQRHVFGLFMTYAITQLEWSKSKASTTMAAFWCMFCLGRLVAILCSKKWHENVLSRLFNVTTGLGLTMFVITSYFRHSVLITASLLVSSFGMSPLFTYILSWFSTNITPLTGKLIGVVYVFMAIGSMTVPVISGHLMNHVSYQWFLYLLIVLLVMYMVLSVIIRTIYRKVCIAKRELRFV